LKCLANLGKVFQFSKRKLICWGSLPLIGKTIVRVKGTNLYFGIYFLAFNKQLRSWQRLISPLTGENARFPIIIPVGNGSADLCLRFSKPGSRHEFGRFFFPIRALAGGG
jgi:hypothetical protein